jgi:hypothetical protein
MLTRVTWRWCAHPRRGGHTLWKGNPKVREEAEVGDLEGLMLQREIVRREKRPRMATGKDRRAQ